ncbi:MAG TPA: hypothetical protein VJ765_14780, partial [Chitinophagaceae bacterium]|nr:hypothetical protein [Chitinophagaceae bacterium]
RKKITNDKTSSQKASSNLVTLGSIDPCWDCCYLDGCAEECDAGVVAATSIEDINFPGKISGHIKI